MKEVKEILYTDSFRERYQRLPLIIQCKAEKQERIFLLNPFYPSLHTEKLEPKHLGIWSFRIDDQYRVAFKFLDVDRVIFLTVGTHDWVYRRIFF
ncbi:MAG: uncharacterized protein HW383_146 [Candidatus Magasanikbacteria bacterium]|nr:uncharacterized protein [Candidatus Magasanikbacteria bacterium]